MLDKHKELTKLQHRAVTDLRLKTSPRKQNKKSRYRAKRCSICDKTVKRLDVHLLSVHLIKRRSEAYEKGMSLARWLQGHKEAVVTISSGDVKVTVCDGIKDFLDRLQTHITSYTSLAHASQLAEIRMVKDVLNHAVGDEVCSAIGGGTVCQYFAALDKPGGYLQLKLVSCSANYARKIIFACMRAVDFMANSTEKLYRMS